jgi:hypothetical protein
MITALLTLFLATLSSIELKPFEIVATTAVIVGKSRGSWVRALIRTSTNQQRQMPR